MDEESDSEVVVHSSVKKIDKKIQKRKKVEVVNREAKSDKV